MLQHSAAQLRASAHCGRRAHARVCMRVFAHSCVCGLIGVAACWCGVVYVCNTVESLLRALGEVVGYLVALAVIAVLQDPR